MAAQRLEDEFDVPGVSQQVCFDYLSDPRNGADWASFATEVVGHGEPGPDQRVEARSRFLGVAFSIDSRVSLYEEPHAYALAGSAPFRGELGARLHPTDGGTLVVAHLEIDPGRFFPVPGLVLRRALRVQFDKDVGALRRCLRALAEG